jgi:hypothetical protein
VRELIAAATSGYKGKRIIRRVEHNGQVIPERARLPAFDACRQLLAAGVTGELGMNRNGILQLTVDS